VYKILRKGCHEKLPVTKSSIKAITYKPYQQRKEWVQRKLTVNSDKTIGSAAVGKKGMSWNKTK